MSTALFGSVPTQLRRKATDGQTETILANNVTIRLAIGCLAEIYRRDFGEIVGMLSDGKELSTPFFTYSAIRY